MDDINDEVGYGHPPKATRFKTNNTYGKRKRKPRRLHLSPYDAFERVLNQRIPLTLEGERRRIPIAEALILKLRELALSGDRRAIKLVQQLQKTIPTGKEEYEAVREKWAGVRLGLILKLSGFGDPTAAKEATGSSITSSKGADDGPA